MNLKANKNESKNNTSESKNNINSKLHMRSNSSSKAFDGRKESLIIFQKNIGRTINNTIIEKYYLIM